MKTPVNIISDSRGIGGALTNPTEIAHYKGKIRNHYPVTFRGKVYRDSEQCYKALIKVRGTTPENITLMEEIITAKLEQHPILLDAITESGGVEWIESCWHTGYRGSWEGHGIKSAFIRCLSKAYQNLTALA